MNNNNKLKIIFSTLFPKIILTSGKKSWGNLDFSFVETSSIFPEYMVFSVTDKNSCSKVIRYFIKK